MAFSSIPPYLDPSNYWPQQPPTPPNHHNPNPSAISVPPVVEGGTNHLHHLPPPPPPPPLPPHGSGTDHPHNLPPPHGRGSSSIRPRSMANRARQANISMPLAPLNCPRCNSTDTKFCYYNNYSRSQPRHYCNTCRRHWTRGGSLRNVPVGGGCRRNKRSSSNSPATSSDMSAISGVGHGSQILEFGGGHLPSLQYSTNFGEMGMNISSGSSSNFSAPATTLGGGGSNSGSLIGGNMEEQLPFPTGSEPYALEGNLEPSDFITPMMQTGPATTQVVPPVIMEDNNNNNQEFNFSRQFLIPPPENDHQFNWNTTAAWTNVSGFRSSSMSNDLA